MKQGVVYSEILIDLRGVLEVSFIRARRYEQIMESVLRAAEITKTKTQS